MDGGGLRLATGRAFTWGDREAPRMSSYRLRADSPEDAEFRATFRAWLERELPAEYCFYGERPPNEVVVDWHKRLYRGGYVAPHWPKQYGGMGATLREQIILAEELARAARRSYRCQGINHIGPILMSSATTSRRPSTCRRSCAATCLGQGYSEPDSGSDLASLRRAPCSTATRFIVNGQKIWQTWVTTPTGCSCWCAPTRTAEEAGRHQLPAGRARHAGHRIRPTHHRRRRGAERDLLRRRRVPAENLVGPLNGGWAIANELLAHERLGIANPSAIEALGRLEALGRANGAIDNPVFRDRLADVRIKVVTQAALFSHAVSLTASGRHSVPTPRS